jgi:hypothetical protein
MSGTVLDNPLVRDYLRALDTATASLPGAQARELREQITAHLDEALPAEASDADVTAELRRLGAPRALAAEAAGPGPRPAAQRLRHRLSRVRWWAWTIFGTALAAVIAVAVYLSLVLTVEPLSSDGGSAGWYFALDAARSVDTQAGGITQSTVPQRYNQPQGWVVTIFNNTDWTQTILGPAPDMESVTSEQATVAVACSAGVECDGEWDSHTRWTIPASIPPHSIRLLRVLWTFTDCGAIGRQEVFQDVDLRVRVGLVTRTETIHMDQAWGLVTTKASRCGSNG